MRLVDRIRLGRGFKPAEQLVDSIAILAATPNPSPRLRLMAVRQRVAEAERFEWTRWLFSWHAGWRLVERIDRDLRECQR